MCILLILNTLQLKTPKTYEITNKNTTGDVPRTLTSDKI